MGLLVSLVALIVGGCLVPERIATGELHPSSSQVAAPPPLPTGSTRSPLPGDDGVRVRHLVAPGESMASILREHGLSQAEIQAWEQAAAATYPLDPMEPKHAFDLTFARGHGQLIACEYQIDRYSVLSLRLQHGQIRSSLKAMPRLAAVRGVVGRVGASLVTTADAVSLPVQMIGELAGLFGWKLNLAADPAPGDEFRILYEELHDDEATEARSGDILAAEIISGGRTLTAVRFESEDGTREYFDFDGRKLGGDRALRYPVDVPRITSRFSGSRFHPVLKRRRPHRGIDFSAPTGTPVKAVASGVVTYSGWNGQYGRQVRIRHADPYASSYSHLRQFGPGVRSGTQVRKGQVIGYVGRSGMATGPHLHFMLFKNGAYVNPLAERFLANEQLSGSRWERFAQVRDRFVERLAALSPLVKDDGLAPRSLTAILRSDAASYVR